MSSSPQPERPDPPATDLVRLVARVGEGDETAFVQLFDALHGRCLGLAKRLSTDDETAEEAVLDAFHQLWAEARRYRPARGSVAAWVLTMVRSRALDRRRRDHRWRSRCDVQEMAEQLVDQTTDPAGEAQRNDAAQRVRTAAADLPRGQREAIAAAFYAGLTHTEIAEHLGLPIGTVKTRIRSGMQTLRGVLDAADTPPFDDEGRDPR